MQRLGLLLARLIARAMPRRGTTRTWGARGERAASRFLRSSGYRVLGRNLRTRFGEADILCEAPDQSTIVLVEVKTRVRAPDAPLASRTIAPEASVTAKKRRTLLALARHLRKANNWTNRPIRIDVIAVEYAQGSRRPTIRHLVDAVRSR